jgi:hypothetical protein
LALDESELLDKAEARQALGLEPDQLAVLIQLGAGNINDTTTPANIVIRRLAQWANLQIVLSEPMISIESVAVPPQVKKVTIYPISKYYRAFDFVVSASGYNSYHELIAFAIPTIFVPNMETSLDDQAARARYAQEVGAALCLEAVTEEDVDRCVKVMLDRDKRAAMAARCREVFPGNGADAAAKVIRDIMDRWPRLRKARPREGTLRAAQGRLDAAANVAPPAPAGPQGARRANWQSLALRTRHRLGAVRRLLWRCARRAKWAFRVFLHGPFPEKRRLVAPIPLLVMAWGLSDEELEQAVERVRRLEVMIREFTPIFVTDSDACHILRRYRHLFEYIPPETEWNKYHPEGTWAEFRDKRIRHILEIYRPAKILVVEDKSGFEAMEKGLLNVLLQQGE